MFLKGLLFCLTLLPLGILAALDDKAKLANRTIDRVSVYMWHLDAGRVACVRDRGLVLGWQAGMGNFRLATTNDTRAFSLLKNGVSAME